MKNIKQIAKKLWQDESAQGATEYILLLMVVVAIVLLFRERIQEAVQGRVESLGTELGNFNVR